MSHQSCKDEYRDFLEDMTCEYCEPNKYCILKEFLISAHTSRRLLMQIKAVDKFKMEKSKGVGHDIGWAKAMSDWVEEGFAKKFGDEYNENISFSALYKKIRN